MKIGSSTISMQGVSEQTSYTRLKVTQQSTVIKVNNLGDTLELHRKDKEKTKNSMSEHMRKIKKMLQEEFKRAEQAKRAEEASINEPLDKNEIEIGILKRLLKHLTGKDISLKSLKDIRLKEGEHPTLSKVTKPLIPFRLVEHTMLKREIEVYESESFSFKAQGVVKTTDGMEINISVELNMSREFYAKISESTEQLKFVDPLIINFNGTSAELKQDKFRFDLDCDGEEDQISKLGAGSGFLAYDKDNNGKIDDGNELFGATSGDGFKDLAAYDDDGNGWIDENDDIFNKLRIWTFDENGNSVLSGLGEKGVGAIYLGNVDTLFNVRDNDEIQGMLRKTGIYLNENGTAGTIQHVDFRL